MASALGAGLLTLPKVFKDCGLVLASIFLILGACSSYLTMVALSEYTSHYLKKKIKITRYSQLVAEAYGRKAELLSTLSIMMFCYGCVVSYQIIMTGFWAKLLTEFGVDEKLANS